MEVKVPNVSSEIKLSRKAILKEQREKLKKEKA
jgi:hypothetical protein